MKNNLINVFFLWLSTLIAGGINYLYYPIMLNFLSIEQFAEFGSLVAIFNILSVLTGALWLFIVKEMSKDIDDFKTSSLFFFWIKYISFIWVIFYLIFLLIYPLLSKFLEIHNFILFLIVGFSMIISFSWVSIWSLLQSKKRFKFLWLTQILNPIFKLIIWVLLVYLWFNIYWALFWLIISQILIFLLTFIVAYKYIINLKIDNKVWDKDIFYDFKIQKKQIFHYMLASLILAVFMNADILFAKHFFDNTNAWIYSGISVMAKFALFAWMSIETVYYPIIIGENKINKFKFAMIWFIYLVILILWLIFLFLFWEFFLEFMKEWFWEYINLLYLIVIYSIFLALVNFFVKIYIWFEKYFINYILIFSLFLLVGLLYIFVWNSVYDLIFVFVSVMTLLVLFNYVYLWKIKR